MANIKNLQMWNTICADARICVSKSLFGLCSKVVFKPTNSEIKAKVLEYSSEDGKRIKHMLESPIEKLATMVGESLLKPTLNGTYLVEVGTSQDGAFVAIQLFQFSQLNYVPATDVMIYEGNDASLVMKLF